jgi:hypothetical protein
METSLFNFYFADHSQKQQKAKIVLMLSTVISVFTICYGNHASASAWMVLSLCQEAEKICCAGQAKESWNCFSTLFPIQKALTSKSVVPEVQKYWMR